MSGPSQNPLKDLVREAHRRSLWQVLGVYVVSGWVVLQVVDVLVDNFGLPSWFPAFAVGLLLIGLPIVLATAFVQEGGPGHEEEDEHASSTPVEEEEAVPSSRLFTWRNAILGGVAASLLWAGLAAGWLLFGDGEISTSLTGETRAADASAPPQQSVAVLPFDNMSADPENEYFSDGITEEILHALTQVEGLRVPGRTSSFAFEGDDLTISQIADTLDVTHVVEGSVRRAGERVRITAQLIDARSDEHLWSDTYERRLEDVFAVQEEIARSITEALEVRLGGGDTAHLAMEGTDDPEAHDAYLRGRYFWNQRTAESLRRAADRFRTAIERDSSYAEAWSGLADTYSTIPWYLPDDSLDLSSLRSRSLEAARRSVELAPDRAITHTSLAYAHFFNGDWEEAEREFERAIELNPDYPTARHWYGEYLAYTGRAEEGVVQARRAIELDPVSKIAHNDLALVLTYAGRPEDAAAQMHRALALDPGWPTGLLNQASFLFERGRYEESLEIRLEALQILGADTTGVRAYHSCWRGYAETGEAQECDDVPPDWRNEVYFLITGQEETFISRLERRIENGELDYRVLAQRHSRFGISNWYPDLRDDPRYRELMDEVGIDW